MRARLAFTPGFSDPYQDRICFTRSVAGMLASLLEPLGSLTRCLVVSSFSGWRSVAAADLSINERTRHAGASLIPDVTHGLRACARRASWAKTATIPCPTAFLRFAPPPSSAPRCASTSCTACTPRRARPASSRRCSTTSRSPSASSTRASAPRASPISSGTPARRTCRASRCRSSTSSPTTCS